MKIKFPLYSVRPEKVVVVSWIINLVEVNNPWLCSEYCLGSMARVKPENVDITPKDRTV